MGWCRHSAGDRSNSDPVRIHLLRSGLNPHPGATQGAAARFPTGAMPVPAGSTSIARRRRGRGPPDRRRAGSRARRGHPSTGSGREGCDAGAADGGSAGVVRGSGGRGLDRTGGDPGRVGTVRRHHRRVRRRAPWARPADRTVERSNDRTIERSNRRTIERARRLDLPAVMITFDRHPATVAGPARDTATLSTPLRRAELARIHGIDAVLVLEFTPRLARTPAADFVRHVLVGALPARAVVVGDGFRFDPGGRGDLDVLRDPRPAARLHRRERRPPARRRRPQLVHPEPALPHRGRHRCRHCRIGPSAPRPRTARRPVAHGGSGRGPPAARPLPGHRQRRPDRPIGRCDDHRRVVADPRRATGGIPRGRRRRFPDPDRSRPGSRSRRAGPAGARVQNHSLRIRSAVVSQVPRNSNCC